MQISGIKAEDKKEYNKMETTYTLFAVRRPTD
jgi:hypothetical protein